jgi:hypothetical protein
MYSLTLLVLYGCIANVHGYPSLSSNITAYAAIVTGANYPLLGVSVATGATVDQFSTCSNGSVGVPGPFTGLFSVPTGSNPSTYCAGFCGLVPGLYSGVDSVGNGYCGPYLGSVVANLSHIVYYTTGMSYSFVSGTNSVPYPSVLSDPFAELFGQPIDLRNLLLSQSNLQTAYYSLYVNNSYLYLNSLNYTQQGIYAQVLVTNRSFVQESLNFYAPPCLVAFPALPGWPLILPNQFSNSSGTYICSIYQLNVGYVNTSFSLAVVNINAVNVSYASAGFRAYAYTYTPFNSSVAPMQTVFGLQGCYNFTKYAYVSKVGSYLSQYDFHLFPSLFLRCFYREEAVFNFTASPEILQVSVPQSQANTAAYFAVPLNTSNVAFMNVSAQGGLIINRFASYANCYKVGDPQCICSNGSYTAICNNHYTGASYARTAISTGCYQYPVNSIQFAVCTNNAAYIAMIVMMSLMCFLLLAYILLILYNQGLLCRFRRWLCCVINCMLVKMHCRADNKPIESISFDKKYDVDTPLALQDPKPTGFVWRKEQNAKEISELHKRVRAEVKALGLDYDQELALYERRYQELEDRRGSFNPYQSLVVEDETSHPILGPMLARNSAPPLPPRKEVTYVMPDEEAAFADMLDFTPLAKPKRKSMISESDVPLPKAIEGPKKRFNFHLKRASVKIDETPRGPTKPKGIVTPKKSVLKTIQHVFLISMALFHAISGQVIGTGFQNLQSACSGTSVDFISKPKVAEMAATLGGTYTFQQLEQSPFTNLGQPVNQNTFQSVVGVSAPTITGTTTSCTGTTCTCNINAGLGQANLYPGSVISFNADCPGINGTAPVTISIQSVLPVYKYNYLYTSPTFNWVYLQDWECYGWCTTNQNALVPPDCVGYNASLPFYYSMASDWSFSLSGCCYTIGQGFLAASATAMPSTSSMVHVYQATLQAIQVVSCVNVGGNVNCYNSAQDSSVVTITLGSLTETPSTFMLGIVQQNTQVNNVMLGNFPLGGSPQWSGFGDLQTVGLNAGTCLFGQQLRWNTVSPCNFGDWVFGYCTLPNGYMNDPNVNYISSITCPNSGEVIVQNALSNPTTNFYPFGSNSYGLIERNATLSWVAQNGVAEPELNMVTELVDNSYTGIVGYTNVIALQVTYVSEWNAEILSISLQSCSGCVGCPLSFSCLIQVAFNPGFTLTFSVALQSPDTSLYVITNSLVVFPPVTQYNVTGVLYTGVSTVELGVYLSGAKVADISTTNLNIITTSPLDQTAEVVNTGSNISVSADNAAGTTQYPWSMPWWEETLIIIAIVVGCILLTLITIKGVRLYKARKLAEEHDLKVQAENDKANKLADAQIAQSAAISNMALGSLSHAPAPTVVPSTISSNLRRQSVGGVPDFDVYA